MYSCSVGAYIIKTGFFVGFFFWGGGGGGVVLSIVYFLGKFKFCFTILFCIVHSGLMLDAGAFQIFFYITINESYCSPTTANNSGSYASDSNHNSTNHGLIDGVGRLVREDTGGQTRHHFLHTLLVT